MNSATLNLADPVKFQGVSPFGASPVRQGFQLGKKGILIFLRVLVFTILSVFFFSARKNDFWSHPATAVFFMAYLVSIAGMIFFRPGWLEHKNFLPALFVLDMLFITLGLYLCGIAETDLFLIFFTTVFISALSQEVKSVFSVAVVSCALYGFLQYKNTGQFLTENTESLIRFPFLFVAAAMSGFLAMDAKKRKEENLRLVDINQILAGQADSSAQKLVETNRKLKSLLEYHHCVLSSLKTGVIVTQRDGKIRTFNSGARRITGYVEAEMAGKYLEELPENLEPVTTALRRALEEGNSFIQDHLELVSARSETIPVTLETSPLKGGNGEVMGAIATLKDMTLLRQMETQLLRSERFSALGEMAAGVAHEIKNPLNSVMGFSKRLSAKLEDLKLKKYAEIISEEVVRMDSIVNDVLEYSRPDKASKTPEDLNRILEETLVFLDEKLRSADVTVERVYGELPRVPLDLPKIRQVILNLVLNALQAMSPGGKLTLTTKLIEGLVPEAVGGKGEGALFQQLFLRQKMAAVEVRDTGCGIPRENLSKIFHPFFTTKITGTGLGLSICHKIIASHGGTLNVESVVDKGTAFTLYLPIEDE